MQAQHRLLLLIAERTSWAFGLFGVLCWGAFEISVALSARQDLERFAALQLVTPQVGTPDQSLWSLTRVSAWHEALSEPAAAPPSCSAFAVKCCSSDPRRACASNRAASDCLGIRHLRIAALTRNRYRSCASLWQFEPCHPII